MARRGSWDVCGTSYEWFDVDANVLGWWDKELVPGTTPPPPPKPKPKPPRPQSPSGGGGGQFYPDYCPPPPIEQDAAFRKKLDELLNEQPIEKYVGPFPDVEEDVEEATVVIVEVPVVVTKEVPTTIVVRASSAIGKKRTTKKKRTRSKRRATARVLKMHPNQIVILAPPPEPIVLASAPTMPWGRILLAVGAGLLIGYLIFGRKPKPEVRQGPRKGRGPRRR